LALLAVGLLAALDSAAHVPAMLPNQAQLGGL